MSLYTMSMVYILLAATPPKKPQVEFKVGWGNVDPSPILIFFLSLKQINKKLFCK